MGMHFEMFEIAVCLCVCVVASVKFDLLFPPIQFDGIELFPHGQFHFKMLYIMMVFNKIFHIRIRFRCEDI